MLHTSLGHRRHINSYITDMDLHNEFTLSAEDWGNLKYMSQLLRAFNVAHLQISPSKHVTAPFAILAFDKVMKAIMRHEPGNSKYEIFRQAAFRNLIQYEEVTKFSPLYSLAVLLDPRFKKQPLSAIGWEEKQSNERYQTLLDTIMLIRQHFTNLQKHQCYQIPYQKKKALDAM